MKSYGHIKLSRKAFDDVDGDQWWHEQRVFSRWEAWVYLIQLAQWHPTTLQTTRFGSIALQRGEFVASIRSLAERFQWGVKQVRIFLGSAQNGARLKAQRETQAGIVYLVVNYDTYQSSQSVDGKAKGTPKGEAGAQRGHKNNTREAGKAVTTSEYPADFELLWNAYPKRSGSNNKQKAFRQFELRLAEGISFQAMYDGARRCAAWAHATGKVGTEVVQMTSTFLGPNRHFAEEWALPAAVVSAASPAEAEAARIWSICKKSGVHHATKDTIDSYLDQLQRDGEIVDRTEFLTTLRKLDVRFLRTAYSDKAAVASIVERIA